VPLETLGGIAAVIAFTMTAACAVSGPCRGSCEIDDWPRVIIAAPAGTSVSYAASSEGNHQVVAHGCPTSLPKDFVCSYSVLAGPMASELELGLTTNGETQAHTIQLRPYNTCGREIAYVEVTGAGDGGGVDVRYINPCTSAGTE
jgi:hypothetical protein